MKFSVAYLVLTFGLCIAAQKVDELPCGALFRCSYVEDIVWATDGKKCYVFRNPCFLAIENCERERKKKPDLDVIPKEKCQTLCDSKYPKDGKPVCGYYNDEFRDFASLCEMNYYICKTGETFTLYNEGPCK